jgi:hypothetical protein
VSRYFLNAARTGFEPQLLYVQPVRPIGVDAGGDFTGEWRVGDGAYQGTAGVSEPVLFWVEGGLNSAIIPYTEESLERTYGDMRRRLDRGDTAVVPTEAQQEELHLEAERVRRLPRLRIPGEPPFGP